MLPSHPVRNPHNHLELLGTLHTGTRAVDEVDDLRGPVALIGERIEERIGNGSLTAREIIKDTRDSTDKSTGPSDSFCAANACQPYEVLSKGGTYHFTSILFLPTCSVAM